MPIVMLYTQMVSRALDNIVAVNLLVAFSAILHYEVTHIILYSVSHYDIHHIPSRGVSLSCITFA